MYMLQIDVFTVLTSSLLVGCGLFLALILIWRFFLKKKNSSFGRFRSFSTASGSSSSERGPASGLLLHRRRKRFHFPLLRLHLDRSERPSEPNAALRTSFLSPGSFPRSLCLLRYREAEHRGPGGRLRPHDDPAVDRHYNDPPDTHAAGETKADGHRREPSDVFGRAHEADSHRPSNRPDARPIVLFQERGRSALPCLPRSSSRLPGACRSFCSSSKAWSGSSRPPRPAPSSEEAPGKRAERHPDPCFLERPEPPLPGSEHPLHP